MIFFFRRSEISLDHPRSLCGREEQWLRVQCEHLTDRGSFRGSIRSRSCVIDIFEGGSPPERLPVYVAVQKAAVDQAEWHATNVLFRRVSRDRRHLILPG